MITPVSNLKKHNAFAHKPKRTDEDDNVLELPVQEEEGVWKVFQPGHPMQPLGKQISYQGELDKPE